MAENRRIACRQRGDLAGEVGVALVAAAPVPEQASPKAGFADAGPVSHQMPATAVPALMNRSSRSKLRAILQADGARRLPSRAAAAGVEAGGKRADQRGGPFGGVAFGLAWLLTFESVARGR